MEPLCATRELQWRSYHVDTVPAVFVLCSRVVSFHVDCDLVLCAAASHDTQRLRIGVIEPKVSESLASMSLAATPDVRVFAITPASRRILELSGVWSAIQAHRAPAFDSMQIWDALGDGFVRFAAADAGEQHLGYIVENRVLQSALFDALRQLASTSAIDLLCPATVKSIIAPRQPVDLGILPPPELADGSSTTSVGDEFASVVLADGRVLRSRLIVGADGADSAVRKAANIGVSGWDYDQMGVVATVRTNRLHTTAWQRFLPSGPVAILPVSASLHTT